MSDEALLHISLIPGIGPAVIRRLQEVSDGELYAMDAADYTRRRIVPHQAQLLVTGLRDASLLHKELERAVKYQAQVITVQSPHYPTYLRAIHMPPPVLYVRGSIDSLESVAIAIIGSRAANVYGRTVVEEFIPHIVAEKWVVISGGARGIDAYAHQETVRHGGITVAVLGSGLLRPYPREHTSLFSEIIAAGGSVVSPFPLTMNPLPGNFPARNRIISGLARASVVVQAAEKSGALITAMQALAEGREVGAVPGHITDALSAGCHKLLKEGALPITSAHDLRELMGLPSGHSVPMVERKVVQRTPIEEACRRTPRSFDELLIHVDGDEQQLHQQLWDLQIAGSIEQTNTGLWRLL